MTQTKTGSPFYLLSLSNMLDLIHCTSVHSRVRTRVCTHTVIIAFFINLPHFTLIFVSISIFIIFLQKHVFKIDKTFDHLFR